MTTHLWLGITIDAAYDGEEALKVLKSRPHTASIPIVLLTGVEIDGGRVKPLSLGATEYVLKSSGLSKLYAQVSLILGIQSSSFM